MTKEAGSLFGFIPGVKASVENKPTIPGGGIPGIPGIPGIMPGGGMPGMPPDGCGGAPRGSLLVFFRRRGESYPKCNFG